jgi:RNA recognition motif-containing protein
MSAQQNSFSNDGSFLAQFMKQTTGSDDAAAARTDQGAEASGDGGAQHQQAAAQGDYSQYYADYAAYYGGYAAAASPYGAYGGYPGYGQQQHQAPQMQQHQGMHGGGGYGGGYGGGHGGGRGPMRNEGEPSRSLWVGNVSPDASEHELQAIFQQFGPVDAVKMITHKNCAFVVYADLDSAMEAYNNLTHQRPYLRGQELRIGWGKADTRDHTRREQRDDDTGPRSKNLWIGGLGPDVFEEDMREKFRPYGRIEHIKLLPEKKCGFVNFDNVDSAMRAKRELQGQYIRGRPMRINYGRIEGDDRPAPPRDRPMQAPSMPSPVSAPPPRQVPPPADPAMKTVIDKMADYVSRNGSAFEKLMRERERNNPKLQFIFEGHEFNPYYEWKLASLLGHAEPEGGAGGASHAPPQADSYQDQMPEAPSGPLSPQERIQLGALLEALDGTKDPIKAGKDWIFQHWAQAGPIADELRVQVERFRDWDKKLLTLYLVNDVLHHALAQRTDVSSVDAVSEAFKLPAVFMFRAAYHGQPPEKQQKILQLLRLWESRNIYGAVTIQRMEQAIVSPTAPAEPPHTLNTTGVPPPVNPMAMAMNPAQLAYGYLAQQQQQQQQQQQPYQHAGGYGVQAAGMPPQQQAYNTQPFDYAQQQQQQLQQLEAGRKRRRSPSPERSRDYDRDDRGGGRDRDREEQRGWSRDRDREDRGSRDRDRRDRKSGWDA